jgi:hypothetical protein
MPSTTDTRPAGRRKLGRSLAAAVGAGALLSAGLFSTSTATAATVTQNFTLAGTIVVASGANPVVLPAGSGFSATVDTTTGAITNGHTAIPVFTISVDVGGNPVPVDVTITDTLPADGNVNATTGAMNLSMHLSIGLNITALSALCAITPVNVQPSTANPGGSPQAGTPLTATLTASAIGVPEIGDPDGTCSIASAANGLLGLPSDTGTMTITLVETDVPVTTTTSIATPTTKAPAAPAPAVKAAANFTG